MSVGRDENDYGWCSTEEKFQNNSTVNNMQIFNLEFATASSQAAVAKKAAEQLKELLVTNIQRMYHRENERKRTKDNTDNKGNMLSGLFTAGGILIVIITVLLPVFMLTVTVPAMVSAVVPQKISIVEVAERELEVYEENIGGQKYKDWYGINGNWCAMFVSYCANECGFIEDEIMPKSASVLIMSEWYKEKEQWVDVDGYTPKAGDIIFFQNNASHVGIVVDYDESKNIIYTIEGNTGASNTEPYHLGSRVKKCSYPITYVKISGYGLPSYPHLEENNNAELIEVNTEHKDTLETKADVNWYKVKIANKGYFKIQFSLEDTESLSATDGFEITVYDKQFKKIITYDDVRSPMTGGILPYEKGTYYVKVKVISSDDTEALDYGLQVVHTEDSFWESEHNNTFDKADSLKLNKSYSGVLLNSKDEDWFKFTVRNAGTVKIKLKSVNEETDRINDGWSLYVYDGKVSTPIAKMEKVTNQESLTLELKKDTYYMKVCSNDTSPIECIYKVNVNYSQTPKKVVIDSIKYVNKKVSIRWEKAERADGYIIYRSTSKDGTYKKIATITEASAIEYTDKKSLKKGQTYYYKIVSYNKSNGVTAYASASKIKSVKVK